MWRITIAGYVEHQPPLRKAGKRLFPKAAVTYVTKWSVRTISAAARKGKDKSGSSKFRATTVSISKGGGSRRGTYKNALNRKVRVFFRDRKRKVVWQ
jgi:hypothetical protein